MLGIEAQSFEHELILKKAKALDAANKVILELEYKLEQAKKEYNQILDYYYFQLGV